MQRRLIRWMAGIGFLLNVLAVTWPVLGLFRSPEPFILVMPMSMLWPITWIVISLVVLLILDNSEKRHESE